MRRRTPPSWVAAGAAESASGEGFADALGVHRTYLGGLERGERNLTLQTLEALAEQLHVEPLALLIDPE